jgi:hypothetical protein
VIMCCISSTQWHFLADWSLTQVRKSLFLWRPQGDSNPRYRRERAGETANRSKPCTCLCAELVLIGETESYLGDRAFLQGEQQ